jgi:putative multiple sugar transport system permease protein
VYLFFMVMTGGSILKPLNFNALITQNAYVYILAAGMLMCMLTGGNIDLSCGSFVCLVGAVGGVMMVIKGMNTGLSIALMLLLGIAYGCGLGYLIAYVHIPPWIATLAGYLAFRGLGTSILSANSKTGSIAPLPEDFLKIFSGKVWQTKMSVFNWPCMTVGIVAAVITVAVLFLTRQSRIRKGYEADSMSTTLVKSVASAAAILFIMYKLSKAGGIPTVLIWVVAVVLIYSFITSKTQVGRQF